MVTRLITVPDYLYTHSRTRL